MMIRAYKLPMETSHIQLLKVQEGCAKKNWWDKQKQKLNKIINLDKFPAENRQEHNPDWSQIPHHS